MTDEVIRTKTELINLLTKECHARPMDGSVRLRLARLYASEAYGQDYAKAFEMLEAARECDPACDPSGALTVHWLYKLNRHREALDAWERAKIASGPFGSAGSYVAPTIFYAAMAADRAGESATSKQLARQAVFTYPTHALASQVQELIK